MPTVTRRQATVGVQLDSQIKHDGYRLMARRDPVASAADPQRPDRANLYPLVVEAVNHLRVRSVSDRWGSGVLRRARVGCLPAALRRRRNEPQACLDAFDLLELDGTDMRREPIEVRKATLASILRKSRPGVRLNEHLEHPDGALVFATPARWAWKASCPSGSDRAIVLVGRRIG